MQKRQRPDSPSLTTRVKYLVTLWTLALILFGCQTPPLDVHYAIAEDVDLSQYQTFSIQPAVDSDDRFIEHINEGIINALSQKGYRHSDSADLLIRYSVEIAADQQLRLDSIPGNGAIQTKPVIEAVFEAKMLVNVIDAKSGKVVWKAATSRDLRTVNTQHIEQATVNRRMEELFDSFDSR